MKETNSPSENDNIGNNQKFEYKKTYQTINSTKILESKKEAFTNENYSLAKLYLFLKKLNNQSNFSVSNYKQYFINQK